MSAVSTKNESDTKTNLTLPVKEPGGKTNGTVELPAEIFDVTRARQGSTRAPQFVGGGTVHGPQPRDYTQRLPKKMKAAALRGALSDRARSERIHVITELVAGQAPSTKSAKSFLAELSERKNILVVVGREDVTAWKSVANLQGVHPIAPDQLNTRDVLKSDDVIFSVEALNAFVHGPAEAAQEESK